MTLTAERLWFRAEDGALIHFDAHDAAPIDLFSESGRGVLVTVHGLGEHLGKYDEWAEHAAARGWHVMLYDQRGHGRTAGRRGDFRFDDLVSDLARFIEVTADRYPDLPVFLVAHSLGALVALRYAEGEPHAAVRGAVLSGPPIALAAEVPGWYRWALRILLRIAPWFPLRRKPAVHTRDTERAAAFASDPLCHRRITPRALATTSAAIEALRAGTETIRFPVLVLIGESDGLVDVVETSAFFSTFASRIVTVERIPGARHEVLQEVGRSKIYDRVCVWCAKLAGG